MSREAWLLVACRPTVLRDTFDGAVHCRLLGELVREEDWVEYVPEPLPFCPTGRIEVEDHGPVCDLPCGWCGSVSGYETETDGWRRCLSCGGC